MYLLLAIAGIFAVYTGIKTLFALVYYFKYNLWTRLTRCIYHDSRIRKRIAEEYKENP